MLKRIVFVLFLTPTLFSQSQSAFKRNTAAIIFSSISGGIIGLSTLSFYGRPQEHTDNITAGVAIGLLAGVGYLIYDNNQTVQNETVLNKSIWIEPVISKSANKNNSANVFSLNYSW